MLNQSFLRFTAITFFLILTIISQSNTIFAQHPCDTFPVTTCVVPSGFTSWTINDNNATATKQRDEPQPVPFYTDLGNPLKTLWYAYVAPMDGRFVVTTMGTNPAAIAPNYASPFRRDTLLAAYTGTSSIASLVKLRGNDDIMLNFINDANHNCLPEMRPPTESVLSSCIIIDVTAGVRYNFQYDDLASMAPATEDFVLNGYYLAPSAAEVSVSGRITNNSGSGISRVRVSLTKSDGSILTAISNSFGYYRFTNLEVGQTYVLQASSKRFQFQNNPRVISVSDDVLGEDFITDETSFQKLE